MFALIFHELLHPMFTHFIHSAGRLENIAADAIINASISLFYSAQSQGGALFRKILEPKGLDGLMRPGSRMNNSRYRRLYHCLYPAYQWSGAHSQTLSTGELIQTLKILSEDEDLDNIRLLGTHGDGGVPQEDGLERLPAETLGRIADEIKRSLAETCAQHAGYGDALMRMLIEGLRSRLSIRKALLRRFLTKRKIDKFKEHFNDRRVGVSPIPIHPSKRDLVMLAAGAWPLHFHNRISKPRTRERGLAIYLDVSGSVHEHLPKIIGVLRDLRKEITSVFLFSNKVVETSFESLLKGDIQTTGGTDFDCVAESILERDFDKAVIITDGYASMNEELKDKLQRQRLNALTILFGGMTQCEDFESFGETVQLEDVCE